MHCVARALIEPKRVVLQGFEPTQSGAQHGFAPLRQVVEPDRARCAAKLETHRAHEVAPIRVRPERRPIGICCRDGPLGVLDRVGVEEEIAVFGGLLAVYIVVVILDPTSCLKKSSF